MSTQRFCHQKEDTNILGLVILPTKMLPSEFLLVKNNEVFLKQNEFGIQRSVVLFGELAHTTKRSSDLQMNKYHGSTDNPPRMPGLRRFCLGFPEPMRLGMAFENLDPECVWGRLQGQHPQFVNEKTAAMYPPEV